MLWFIGFATCWWLTGVLMLWRCTKHRPNGCLCAGIAAWLWPIFDRGE